MTKKVYSVIIYNKETDAYIDEDCFDTLEEAEQYKEDNEDETCCIEIEDGYKREFFRVQVDGFYEDDYDDIISAGLGIAKSCIKDFLNNSGTEFSTYTIERKEEWA